jgi:membrane protease YdiL (CAAX protease family)
MAVENRRSAFRHVARLVWNPEEARVRALWRIVVATALVLVVPALVFGVVVRQADLPLGFRSLVANGLYAGVTVFVLVIWARYVDRRPLAEYGFALDRTWARGLALGALVGLVGWGGALATDLAFGWARVEAVLSPGGGDVAPAVTFAAFTLQWGFVAFWEEAVFRGLVMRNAIEGLSLPWLSRRIAIGGGLVGSSVLFGVLHAGQATSVLALGFWVLAGLVLGLAYLLTGQLAVPIGLHFAFDFAVNNVFGLASVRPAGASVPTLVRPAFSGPERFVGVSGVVNTAWLLAIGAMVLAVVAWHRGSLRARIGRYTR